MTSVQRRDFIKTVLMGSASLSAPRVVRAESTRVLRFVPQADVAVIDPIINTAYVTRNHAYLVFDTLYGMDANNEFQPQMVEGHTIENDGTLWKLTLRPGLRFHDNEPVLARDVIASLQRWGKRDTFGQTLLAAVAEMTAPTDNVVAIRLHHPFPLLPAALGKVQPSMPAIMPERLAQTPPDHAVSELIGSGPYRFVASERVPGSRVVYQRFDGYRPRPDGTTSFTTGPKVTHFDRVEWTVIPDPATAAAALQTGEVDWWEQPTVDLQPMLQQHGGITIDLVERAGQIGDFRPNHLNRPFSNPAFRRAILGAVWQADFMMAVVGTDPKLWHDGVGVFCPGTPFANDAGIDVITAKRDPARIRAAIEASGYNGERVVFLAASDNANLNALCQVGGDMLHKAGVNVDYQTLDWGTVQKRRTSKEPLDKGGWSCFIALGSGLDYMNPVTSLPLVSSGQDAWFGWPKSDRIEQLRADWMKAPDFNAQYGICREIQQQVWQDVPYIPLGQCFQSTAYRADLTGVLTGFPLFYGVRRS